MGIGRREFLKTFSAAIASVTSAPLRSFVIEDDLYVNYKLGFSCRKPAGWDFVVTYEMGRLVSGPYVDPRDERTLKEISRCAGVGTPGLLWLSSEKISAEDKHIAPMIQVLLDYDSRNAGFVCDYRIAQVYADGFREALGQSKPYAPAELLRISDCDAVRFSLNVTLHENGQSFDWLVDCLSIFQGPVAYVVAMLNPARSTQKFSYDRFVQSIRVA